MSTVMEEESCGDAPFLPLQHAKAFLISLARRRRRLSSSLCCLSLSIVFFLNHFLFVVVIIFSVCEDQSISAVRR